MTDRNLDTVTRLSPPATLETFGFPANPATVVLLARPRSWRLTRAVLSLLISWGLAPVVIFVPPHLPWVLAAILTGPILAYRRLTERHTLRSVSGSCPKCGETVLEETRTRLKLPYSITCPHCHQNLLLSVSLNGDSAP